jgi:transcription initiation factor TFIIIB Brf1 subunit/transcription initiation factor TFIIB
MKECSGTLQEDRLAGNCSCHQPNLTSDGEYVCARCGVVLSDRWEADESVDPPVANQATSPKSNVNLYLAHNLGGHQLKSLPGLSTMRSLEMANREATIDDGMGRKRKSANTYLSRFSNACSKLGLTQPESEHAWRIFARLYSELGSSDYGARVTNTSEIACYAIAAGAVATTQRVLGERTVARAVMFAFHSKSVRDMYCIRRLIETRSQVLAGIAKPKLTSSSRWLRGRL